MPGASEAEYSARSTIKITSVAENISSDVSNDYTNPDPKRPSR